jgi:hypothetical protein
VRPWPALLCTVLPLLCAQTAAGNPRGHDLFSGAAPLRGSIIGHNNALPPQGARCINCHAVGSAAPAASSASFGPLLTRRHLTGLVARRGGPPSRYDQRAFCRLLRQGLDPATVMIARAMPRYDISEADCQALWLLLSDPQVP